MAAALARKTLPYLMILLAFVCVGSVSERLCAQEKRVVAIANGTKVTEGDIDAYCKIFGIENPNSEVRATVRETLIDRILLDKFLKEKKAEVDQEMLDAQMGAFVSVADHTKLSIEELLAKRGLSSAQLKETLSIDLKWQDYSEKNITPQQVKIHFEKNKNRFDGTRIVARQIFWKLPDPMTDEALQTKLMAASSLRERIVRGEITFEEAAKTVSESPSGKRNGGLMEDFAYFGSMPTAITQIAFATREGEISQPFVTPFGIHLLKVEKVQPGTFTLDDVYPVVFERMSQTLKENIVMGLRKDAQIERK